MRFKMQKMYAKNDLFHNTTGSYISLFSMKLLSIHVYMPNELANKSVSLTSPGSHIDHLHRINGHKVHKEWKYVLQQQSALNDKVTWTMVYSH
jgi:hypothetical protein